MCVFGVWHARQSITDFPDTLPLYHRVFISLTSCTFLKKVPTARTCACIVLLSFHVAVEAKSVLSRYRNLLDYCPPFSIMPVSVSVTCQAACPFHFAGV